MERETSVLELRARFEQFIVKNNSAQITSPRLHNRKSYSADSSSSSEPVTSLTNIPPLPRKRASYNPISTTLLSDSNSNLNSSRDIQSISSGTDVTSTPVIELDITTSNADQSQLRTRMGINSIPLNAPVIVNTGSGEIDENIQKQPIPRDIANINKELLESLQKSINDAKAENERLSIENERLKKGY